MACGIMEHTILLGSMTEHRSACADSVCIETSLQNTESRIIIIIICSRNMALDFGAMLVV